MTDQTRTEPLDRLDAEIARRRSPDYQWQPRDFKGPHGSRITAGDYAMQRGELTGLILARALVDAEAREAARLRTALTTLYSTLQNYGDHHEWCIERAVGGQSCECGFLTLIVGLDPARPPDGLDAWKRAALVRPSETRTCPDCGDVLNADEWEGHRLSEGVRP